MLKKITVLSLTLLLFSNAFSQITFPIQIDTNWLLKSVWMPKSPLKGAPLFIGGLDSVSTTPTYNNPAKLVPAKQWHDFIGFTPDKTPGTRDFGWVSVNHEMIQKNDNIGDGGGMTVFKIAKNADSTLRIVSQTLGDGRKGKFFNVDFANTVGETGMNCGGISAPDGRIWTSEEWLQSSNASFAVRDTQDITIGITTPNGFPGYNGKKLKKYQSVNWMVEIDPKQAVAIRKQYNWGRMGFEGGTVMPDNKTVYLYEDNSPAILVKFVATVAGDFTKGKTYAYKHNGTTSKWLEINQNLDSMIRINELAITRGATMFNRLEWGAEHNGKVYITETGRDAFNFNSGIALKGVISPTLVQGYKERFKAITGSAFTGTDAAAADSVRIGKFLDFYGRLIVFDPATETISTHIHGGPFAPKSGSDAPSTYPTKHLSNPDGLNFMKIGTKTYALICEDLNGVNWNRMPSHQTKTVSELYMLDMSIATPTYSDLIRISACPPGAEITGAVALDNNTVLLNLQHPDGGNNVPFNNSLTYAITGFNRATSLLTNPNIDPVQFSVFPNPVSRELHLNKAQDIAIYNANGARIRVERGCKVINVENLNSGVYFIRNGNNESLKFIVE